MELHEDSMNELDSRKHVEQDNVNEDKIVVEKDLGHFLWVDRRHDIWNQIEATKAEIKELERSMQGVKRKRSEGQNQ